VSEKALPTTEVSEDFIRYMRNRMLVSYYKYGPLAEAYPHRVNALETLQDRLKKYEATGNTEWLVDAANMAMIEFMRPAHPQAHFRPTDSNESPGRVTKVGRTSKSNKEIREEARHAAADRFHALVEKTGPLPSSVLCASEPWPTKTNKKGGEKGMTKAEMVRVANEIVTSAVLAVDKEADRKVLKPQWRKDLKTKIVCALETAAAEGLPKRGRKAGLKVAA
jgi:hypothetical protein